MSPPKHVILSLPKDEPAEACHPELAEGWACRRMSSWARRRM